MPDPTKFKKKDQWMNACMHQMVKVEGKPQDEAVAVCLDLWRTKDKKTKKKTKNMKKADEVPMSVSDYLRDLAESVIYKFSEEPVEKEEATKPEAKGFFDADISKTTKANKNFREVLYTGKNSQMVLMSLKPGQDIGDEVHDVDQFFRVEEGKGDVIINDSTYKIKDDSAIIVPAGAKHNFINTGKKALKLYSIYSPPHHESGIIHTTKDEAIKDSEEFDGRTSE